MNRRYCNGMVHVIRQGETLYQLSRKYRVPLALLLRANPYVDVYNLQVGQEICIPMVRPNGMICVPVQESMPREERSMDQRNMDQMQEMDEIQERQMMPEEVEEERVVQMEPCCGGDEIEMHNQNDDDDLEIYVTSGGRSLGDILNEYGVNWEDFVRNNNLSQVALGDDVVLYFPKKNRNR